MTEVKMKLKAPTVPNYAIIDIPADGIGEAKIKIGDLTDEELESLVSDWRNELFERARYQREQAKVDQAN